MSSAISNEQLMEALGQIESLQKELSSTKLESNTKVIMISIVVHTCIAIIHIHTYTGRVLQVKNMCIIITLVLTIDYALSEFMNQKVNVRNI